MSEEKVVSEATETQEPEINADSEVEDIVASQEKADDSEEVTSSETEQSDESGEDVKTPEDEVDTSEKSDDEVKEGDPIPYKRFKEVNDKIAPLEAENEQQRTDLEQAQEALQDPEVLQLILKKRGYTDQAIADYFKENQIEAIKPSERPEFDKNTVEGWDKYIDHRIEQKLKPVEQTLSQKELEQKKAERSRWVDEQETEAKALSKDKYGIEFGTIRKDELNTNTAVGKMWSYLEKNPKDAELGYVKLLKLAMSDEAVAKGVEKGVKKEKERLETVKAAASEGDASITTEESPNANWDVERIQEWRDKHPE